MISRLATTFRTLGPPLALLLASSAAAQPTSEGGLDKELGVEPIRDPQIERLDHAVSTYQRGDLEAARGLLVAIVLDTEVLPDQVRQEARIYLGELLFTQGEREEARTFFEQAIRQDPNYRIDPFVHPPEICEFFDYVRALTPVQGKEPIDQPPPPPPPPKVMPYSVWSPVARYHFENGRRARGYVYQYGFVASSTASLVMAGVLLSDRRYPEGQAGAVEGLQLRVLRGAQLTVTVAAWGFYVGNVVDARFDWIARNGRPRSATLGVTGANLRF